MLDITYIRENSKTVKQACKDKNLNPDVVDNLLTTDEKRRELIGRVQELRTQRNTLSKQLQSKRDEKILKQAGEVKQQLQDIEPQLRQTEEVFEEFMLQVPNVPLKEVPVGSNDSDNKVVRTWGDKPKIDKPKDHVELSKLNDLIDEHAPNLKKLFEEYPEVKKAITFPDGNINPQPMPLKIIIIAVGINGICKPTKIIAKANILKPIGINFPEIFWVRYFPLMPAVSAINKA